MLFDDILNRYISTTLVIIELLVISASAHSLWVETEDVAEVGDVKEVYSFFGHATSSTGIYVPLMNGTYLVTPDGQRLDLATETRNWLAGYGWMDGVLVIRGRVLLARRLRLSIPEVSWSYDMAWHGEASDPKLYCDSAKAIIHCGDAESDPNWKAGFPLEINFDEAPYELKTGDNFTGTINL